MQKRNFILLIIILTLLVISFFGFLYFRQGYVGQVEDPGETNFLSQFNPFGGLTGIGQPDGEENPGDISNETPGENEPALAVTKVSSVPVAGYTVFMKERFKDVAPAPEIETSTPAKPLPPATESVPALRYVDRATGNIFQTFADKIDERKFSSTLIPKVYEAFFGNKGEAVLMRYAKGDNKTIETFVGILPQEVLGGDSEGNFEIRGTLLPANVKDVSVSPDTLAAFYLFNSGENTIGTILNFSDSKKTQIFDSAFNEWLSYWPSPKTIMLATKPSYLAPGYLYKLDTGTKAMSQVLADVSGLAVLPSPDGKMVLYSDNSMALYVYHTDTKLSESLGVRTLADKCAWNKGGTAVYCAAPKSTGGNNFPDTWYQGEVSFNDEIWKIDPSLGSTELLADPAAIAGEEIDGTKLSLDPNENFLFFVNKKDSYLWRVDLR